MHRIEKTGKLNIRMDRYDRKKYLNKKKKLPEDLKIGEKVYLLVERIKKKSAPGKFYKQSVQNISYLNKETVYITRKKQLIDGIRYYWVRSPINDLPKGFLRTEIFALKSNFNFKKLKKNQDLKKIQISKNTGLIKYRTIKFRTYKIRSKFTPELAKFGIYILRGVTPRR